MRRGFFTILTLVLATTIAISSCKAEGPSNEALTPGSTHPREAGGAIDDEWEMTSFDAEGFDSSRFDLLKARIMDGTFKDINSIVVVKHGKILIKEYFNGAGPNVLHRRDFGLSHHWIPLSRHRMVVFQTTFSFSGRSVRQSWSAQLQQKL